MPGDESGGPAPGAEPASVPAAGRLVVWAVVVAVVAAVVGAALLLPRREPQPAVPARGTATVPSEWHDEPAPPLAPTTGLFPRVLGEVPDLPAVERSDAPIRLTELRGRYVVWDFVFSCCGGTCPRLQAAMQRLQERTAGAADVRLVSVTVDPARDTPEVLREWADRLGADRSRWLFLRLDEADARRLMHDHLKVVADADLLNHSNLLILTDPAGGVRGRYSPLEHANWLDVLQADLALLRAERAVR